MLKISTGYSAATAPPNFRNTTWRGLGTSNGDRLLTHLSAACLLIWKFMNRRLLELGWGWRKCGGLRRETRSHAFSVYWFLLLLANGFFYQRVTQGKGLLDTVMKFTRASSQNHLGFTLGTFQTNSQPGAFTGQTDVTFSKCFAKYCISCLRSFKMKFFKAPPHLPKHGVKWDLHKSTDAISKIAFKGPNFPSKLENLHAH